MDVTKKIESLREFGFLDFDQIQSVGFAIYRQKPIFRKHWSKKMAQKSPSASRMKVESIYTSPQMWAFGPMATVFGAVGLTKIARENVEFISERMAKDIQAQRDFFSCKSLEDVLRLQTEFAQDASQQYAKHFQRTAELLSEAAALGWHEASVKRAREYDDIPL